MSGEKGFKVGHKAWQALSGLFAVYKPAGLSPNKVKHIIKTTLLEEVNALKQRPQKTLVKIVATSETGLATSNPAALRAVEVPSYADHPLVKGPTYNNIPLAVVSMGLDTKASGVMVLAVRQGTKLVNQYQEARLPRQYTIRGRFGLATDTHDAEGKVWQRNTYDHITLEKLDRITSRIQRSYQRELIHRSGVDIQSQEAYELAVRGLLHPVGQTNPLLTEVSCTMFEPPDFELEILSYADTAQYLRKIIHDIGQELKSSAIALQVRRTADGPLTVEHALLKKHWKLDHIAQAIERCRPLVDPSDLVPRSQGREAVRMMQEIDQR